MYKYVTLFKVCALSKSDFREHVISRVKSTDFITYLLRFPPLFHTFLDGSLLEFLTNVFHKRFPPFFNDGSVV